MHLYHGLNRADHIALPEMLCKTTHLQNKCFALKFKFQRNASKFPIFI